MRDIAWCANIAIGTIFIRFSNKASLLAVILHMDIDGVHRQAHEIFPAEATLTEILAHPVKVTFSHCCQSSGIIKNMDKINIVHGSNDRG